MLSNDFLQFFPVWNESKIKLQVSIYTKGTGFFVFLSVSLIAEIPYSIGALALD